MSATKKKPKKKLPVSKVNKSTARAVVPISKVAAGKAKAAKPKKLGALDAAARVLAELGTSLTTGDMIEAMAAKKYWTSPNGQTPASTLYSAIAREIKIKGAESRFVKTERGKFSAKA